MQVLKKVLNEDELAEATRLLGSARFVSGKDTAGTTAREVKKNLQLPANSAEGTRIGELVGAALKRHKSFFGAALPRASTGVLVNRHEIGMEYGLHVDNAQMRRGKEPVRTDLAATLFLSDPKSYDGGELTVHSGALVQKIKLPAGDLFLYPANTRHRVEPVTRGVRHAAVFWVQSMVRNAERRQLLAELERAAGTLRARDPQAPELLSLNAVYNSLLREWMDA
jgi:PKHD-type hydroxylase